jgi:hypothetical protein
MAVSKIKTIQHEDYGTYHIKRFSARQIESLSAGESERKNFQQVYWVIANAMVDEQGARIYGDGDVDKLGDEDMVFLNWIQDEILKHNKMGVREAVKNSEPIQSESSPTV